MAMDAKEIRLVHALPGRVRVKIAPVKNNPSLAGEVRKKFSAVHGVQQVDANPVTGSVLLTYDKAIEPLDFLPALSEAFTSVFQQGDVGSLITPDDLAALDSWTRTSSNGSRSEPRLANRISALFGTLDAEVEKVAGGGADLKVLVPVTLFLLGVGRLLFAKKVPFPTWYDLFWFAFGTFIALNPPGQSRTE